MAYISLLTGVFYFTLFVMYFYRNALFHTKWFTLLVMCIWGLQGFSLYNQIDFFQNNHVTQNLNMHNRLAFVFWVSVLLIILLSLFKKRVKHLLVPLIPLILLNQCTAYFSYTVEWQLLSQGMVLHVMSALVITSILLLAVLQATTLACQRMRLKKNPIHNSISYLPSIENLSADLFFLLTLGFLGLTLLIIFSCLHFWGSVPFSLFMHRFALGCMAWLVFAVLLGVHYCQGARSRFALFATCTGMFCVMLLLLL